MNRLVCLNGKMVPKDEARISVLDHGLLYGDGVFEGIRVYDGKVFLLEKHLRRLYEGAQAIRLDIPMSPEDLARGVNDTVAANGDLRNGYIRLVVTRGVGTLGLNPDNCREPQVIIIYDTIALYPEELYRNGLAVITTRTVRNHPRALPPRIKSLNYLNNILGKIEAIQAGVLEGVMLNSDGCVAEATGDNLFVARDGVVETPSLQSGILEGITRDEVIDICRRQGREVREVNLTLDQLFAADECFLTGTAAEVIPVVRIDGQPIGDGNPGPVTLAILEAYRKLTRGE